MRPAHARTSSIERIGGVDAPAPVHRRAQSGGRPSTPKPQARPPHAVVTPQHPDALARRQEAEQRYGGVFSCTCLPLQTVVLDGGLRAVLAPTNRQENVKLTTSRPRVQTHRAPACDSDDAAAYRTSYTRVRAAAGIPARRGIALTPSRSRILAVSLRQAQTLAQAAMSRLDTLEVTLHTPNVRG